MEPEPSVLVIEAGPGDPLTSVTRHAIDDLAGAEDGVQVVTVRSLLDVLRALRELNVVCTVIDLDLDDSVAAPVLQEVTHEAAGGPVLAFASRPLHEADRALLAGTRERGGIEVVQSTAQLTERLTLHLLTLVPRRVPILRGQQAGQTRWRFHGEKALVIDDDVRNVFALTSVLELHGFAVLFADNGRSGVELLRQHTDTAIVLLDIMMPGMDGYATTAAIRRMPEFAQLPIVALTAKAMRGDRERSLAAGMNDHVTKPIDINDLVNLIHDLIVPETRVG